jgi:hypothetical protein
MDKNLIKTEIAALTVAILGALLGIALLVIFWVALF